MAARVSSKVLLAIASADVASALRGKLEGHGCAVDVVATGTEALERGNAGFDLLVLDLGLEGLDGLKVLQTLRKADLSAVYQVVFLKSGDTPPHVVQRGLDLGAIGLVDGNAAGELLQAPDVLTILKAPDGAKEANGGAAVASAAADACPYSCLRRLSDCPLFTPIDISVGDEPRGVLLSCSYLRTGTAGGSRIYPRCAIGDLAAREEFLMDRSRQGSNP